MNREINFGQTHYEPNLVYDKIRRFRPDVELVVMLLHRDLAIHEPIDDCESQCLEELIADLRALSVQEGSWDEHRHQQWLAEMKDPLNPATDQSPRRSS